MHHEAAEHAALRVHLQQHLAVKRVGVPGLQLRVDERAARRAAFAPQVEVIKERVEQRFHLEAAQLAGQREPVEALRKIEGRLHAARREELRHDRAGQRHALADFIRLEHHARLRREREPHAALLIVPPGHAFFTRAGFDPAAVAARPQARFRWRMLALFFLQGGFEFDLHAVAAVGDGGMNLQRLSQQHRRAGAGLRQEDERANERRQRDTRGHGPRPSAPCVRTRKWRHLFHRLPGHRSRRFAQGTVEIQILQKQRAEFRVRAQRRLQARRRLRRGRAIGVLLHPLLARVGWVHASPSFSSQRRVHSRSAMRMRCSFL